MLVNGFMRCRRGQSELFPAKPQRRKAALFRREAPIERLNGAYGAERKSLRLCGFAGNDSDSA